MLYIFDKDSTIVKPVGPNGNLPASKPSEQILYDGVAQKCDELREAGHILALASNQGGVAFGLVTLADAIAMMKDAADKIGASLYALCSVHPKGEKLGAVRNSVYRKPGPGMIQYLMDALGFAPQDTIFIGDLDSDRLAAEAAGVRFEWADDFFNRDEEVITEVFEPKVEDSSTIIIEEPFPDNDDDDDDEDDNDDNDDESEDEEEDYWAQWEDDGDDNDDNNSSSSSNDGNTNVTDNAGGSVDSPDNLNGSIGNTASTVGG